MSMAHILQVLGYFHLIPQWLKYSTNTQIFNFQVQFRKEYH